MAALSREPGLVVEKGPLSPCCRWGRSSRSMVAALMEETWSLISGARTSSPWRSRTSSNSGRKGCSRLAHTRSLASHRVFRAVAASRAIAFGSPRFTTGRGWRLCPQGPDQGFTMQTGESHRFVQNPALFLAMAMNVTVPNSFQILFHPASCHVTLR